MNDSAFDYKDIVVRATQEAKAELGAKNGLQQEQLNSCKRTLEKAK